MVSTIKKPLTQQDVASSFLLHDVSLPAFTVNAGSTAQVAVPITVPSGYTYLCFAGYALSNPTLTTYAAIGYGSSAWLYVKNWSNTDVTVSNAGARLLAIKTA